MRISDLLDVIEDDTVPIREREIIASERIKEVTMAKVTAEKENRGDAKKKLSRGAVIAIAAAACLLLSVTAFATGFMDRVVSWSGEPAEVPAVMPTPVPTERPETVQAEEEWVDQAISEALNGKQDRDLVIARYGEHAAAPGRIETLQSVDQLKKLLAGESAGLALPFTVPEGYTFLTGFVSYELAAGYAYELASSETKDSGVVVEWYTAPKAGDFISGYTLLFENAAGEELRISGNMLEGSEHMGFGYGETDTVTKVDVKNMDDALVIARTTDTMLYMRKAFAKPVSYVPPMSMVNEYADAVNEFDGIIYEAYSTALDGTALLALTGF